MTSALLGIDVGFSAKGKTTGLAWRVRGRVEVRVAGSSDMEILPRACEAVFYRRQFCNRCRPGLTHHGRGAALRDAGREAVSQLAPVLASACKVESSTSLVCSRWLAL